MPTYEYRCETCSHQFEVFAGMNDPAPEGCESCGAAELTKVLFPVAVHYKGSGFYSTDYSAKKSSTASGDAATAGESSGSGGSDSSSSDGSTDSGSTTSSTSSSSGSSSSSSDA